MPELLTKHLDVTLKLLKDANVHCGTGAPQTILKTCPKDQFCALPTGELCIYDITQIDQMTQIQPTELLSSSQNILPISSSLIIIFLIGLWLGMKLK